MVSLRITDRGSTLTETIAPAVRGSGPDELVMALSRLKELGGLSKRKLRVLADHMTVRRVRRGSVIHSEDSRKGHFYILLSGIGRITCLNRKGARILLEVLGPGNLMCIPPLLPDVRRKVRCETVTDCEVGRIESKTLVQDVFGLQFEPFRQALGLTCGRWWKLLLRHSAFIEQSLDERVIFSLLEIVSKFDSKGPTEESSAIDLSHQDLAHLANGSRAKVSRSLSRLAARKAIVQEGRSKLAIVPERLKAIAGF
jgi:CRP-like cAMP-binding protein